MYSKVNLDELEAMDTDRTDPDVKAVGFELRPEEMRPNVWIYEPGESNNRHKQREQEELYHVMDGSGTMEVEDEEFDIVEGDFVIVPPDSWRQVTAETRLEVLIVGAPNVTDDGIIEGGD